MISTLVAAMGADPLRLANNPEKPSEATLPAILQSTFPSSYYRRRSCLSWATTPTLGLVITRDHEHAVAIG